MLAERRGNDLLVRQLSALRAAFRQTLDDIHYNPVRHGYVDDPRDWPFSSFNRLIARGVYEDDWAAPIDVVGLEFD